MVAYHAVCGSIFLNIEAEDTKGMERLGNKLLTPVHYLFAGKIAQPVEGRYVIKQKFDYESYFFFKTVVASIALPLSVTVGSLVKGVAYFSAETRGRHELLKATLNQVVSHLEEYQKLGIKMSPIDSIEASRESSPDPDHLAIEKETLCEIIALFRRYQIPCWLKNEVSQSACLLGGVKATDRSVQLGILSLDFDNARSLLSRLDKKRYQIQDWSKRNSPKSHLRLYIKENREFIDLFAEANLKVFPLKKAVLDGIEVLVPNAGS